MAEWKQQRFEPLFSPLNFIDTDDLITPEILDTSIPSLTVPFSACIRRENGNPNRGGHYVNVIPEGSHYYISSLRRTGQSGRSQVESIIFRDRSILCGNLSALCDFINHYAGRKFSPEWHERMSDISSGNRPPGSEF